ncbi:uncharacterized protein B0I36DRAFT_348108 [Microdochium trichocladiopsis]|uniref:SAP domain-containing protein n=1 Tax=Microdochium trichocladiopsis TaxID=1682393 RepID=A0A9P8Y875_9PEZI|nr:uncharacterized protein B0I36DRAFT_348108 [Microdochium trichocladiopsis]KAH7032974.1 hypothetical protein B0I36DRAFT_348108 [Microdochium trichocladiopsis]
MTDYASLKVPELKKLLQEKSLSATGNKADLIARLKEHDEAQGGSKPAGGAEDEIDWDDDEPSKPAAATEPAPVPAAAPAPVAPEEPKAETESAQAPESTATGQEAGAEASGEQPAVSETAAPKTDFSAGLASSSVDDEARKRAERAKRFGITATEQTDAEKKKAERAQRFGIEEPQQSSIIKGLDAPLPERRERKRGREGAETTSGGGDRGAKRQQGAGGRNDRNRGRNGRRGGGGGGGGGNTAANGNTKKAAAILADPSEKAKAEARAKRFA